MEALDQLHPEVRRWVRDQGWAELRAVQTRSIGAILGHQRDVVVAASTAAGKTEAVFLPLLTKAAYREQAGLSILYVSPLKALINDQYRRLEVLGDRLELPIVRWHGDAPPGPKKSAMRSPHGVVLITPESIEAMFLRRAQEANHLFAGLDAIVIDELHAFLQGARGLHLASLISRIDHTLGRRVRRIGLSATLGDIGYAARWLNRDDPDNVECIVEQGGAPELRLQVRGYREAPEADPKADELETVGSREALDDIADHLFEVMRGDNHLVFGGSRRTVEALADRLLTRSGGQGVPNEFFPHHGSLSKELREELEARLKNGQLPTTAIATTTLELGIDLGSVKSVAQVGAPRSLAGLKQRLGRSGRRAGAPAILRIYVRERHIGRSTDPLDRLRVETVRAVATVQLLLAKFLEAPRQDPAVATVAVHQLLSSIVERGGVHARQLYDRLFSDGPLGDLTATDFAELIRHLGSAEVKALEQAPDGLLMLGPLGETLTGGRDFYAIFEIDEEWKLVHGSRPLGQIPISNALAVGSLVAFAGRRWRVTDVDDRSKVLSVTPHPAAKLPRFDRQSREPLDDRILEEMRKIYLGSDIPSWLDATAVELLVEARAAFSELNLSETGLVASGDDTHVLLWRGTQTTDVVSVALRAMGVSCEVHDLGITLSNTSPEDARALVASLDSPPSLEALSAHVATLQVAKHDGLVPEPLLRRLWARRHEPFRGALPVVAGEAVAWRLPQPHLSSN